MPSRTGITTLGLSNVQTTNYIFRDEHRASLFLAVCAWLRTMALVIAFLFFLSPLPSRKA